MKPLSLLQRFPPGSSYAFVGNGAVQTECGDRIEEQDFVVRFNLPVVEGFEKSVGRRTDLLICNAFQDPKSRSALITLNPGAILCFLSQREDAEVLKRMEAWSEGFDCWQTLAPDLRPHLKTPTTEALMSGTYGLFFLTRMLQPSKIFLSGFDFFQNSDHYWEDAVQPSAQYHDLKTEARVFEEILSQSSARIEGSWGGPPALLRANKGTLFKRALSRLAWQFLSLGLDLRRWSR